MSYLDPIVASHRESAAADRRDLDAAIRQAGDAPAPRGFREAVVDHAPMAVIAEIKRRSPSKGDLAADLDPADLAQSYSAGGAAALSVLTDRGWFGGSAEDLTAARDACSCPLLRKDFTVSALDVCDARRMGADAVLLIVSVLSDPELRSFAALAGDLGLDALVEVHDEAELERALDVGADMVGVNQRDLATFTVDRTLAGRLGGLIPAGVVRVAESGIRGRDDARRLAEAGYDAVLVGESLLTAADPGAALAALRTGRA